MCACAPALKPLFKSFVTPFSSKVGNSGVKSSALASKGGTTGGGAVAPNPSIAKNRAKFEMADSSRRESLESRVVKVAGGTPYYTPPPLEMARPKGWRPTIKDDVEEEEGYDEIDEGEELEDVEEEDRNEENENNTRRPPAKYRRSAPNFQLDGSFGFTREQPSSNIRHANTINTTTFTTTTFTTTTNANNRLGQFSKLAGEYSVSCRSTHSLAKNGADVIPYRQYFGFVYRPSIWTRRRAKSAIGLGDEREDDDGEEGEGGEGRRPSEMGVKIEHEVRIDYESMTEEEKERWERKRSILDAVDSLW
ncbi:uncharacterized protein DFL_007530 [Arthrobotrys flagrans]|uniref:Uncharacterized protein n=1 Tax=Arthrobotrys flagrans TaxID=97331 RepID=A0A436ZW21_ARTFL|nr:hypothetical protein DFL_007530 [Arthrobotrys flagrans]